MSYFKDFQFFHLFTSFGYHDFEYPIKVYSALLRFISSMCMYYIYVLNKKKIGENVCLDTYIEF